MSKMWPLAPIFMLLAASDVLSTPVSSKFPRSDTGNVRVLFHHDKTESKTSLTLTDPSKNKTFAHACDYKLDSGDFAKFPIRMDVNENGAGSLIYGDKKYRIHSLPEHSGGINCSRTYSQDTASVDCMAPWRAPFQLQQLPSNFTSSCFSPGQPAYGLDRRQQPGPVVNFIDQTRKEGNGDPHQNYYHRQITVGLTLQRTPSKIMLGPILTAFRF